MWILGGEEWCPPCPSFSLLAIKRTGVVSFRH